MKTCRVYCYTCDEFGDVPSPDAAVDFVATHVDHFPGHEVEWETHPMGASNPIDPPALAAGEFPGI